MIRFGGENDQISERLHRSTLALIAAPDLETTLAVLYHSLQGGFRRAARDAAASGARCRSSRTCPSSRRRARSFATTPTSSARRTAARSRRSSRATGSMPATDCKSFAFLPLRTAYTFGLLGARRRERRALPSRHGHGVPDAPRGARERRDVALPAAGVSDRVRSRCARRRHRTSRRLPSRRRTRRIWRRSPRISPRAPAHTRAAYLRDAAALADARRRHAISRTFARRSSRRFLATLHGRGLSGRSLARMLSSWRAFYRLLQDRDPALKENPVRGTEGAEGREAAARRRCRPTRPCASSRSPATSRSPCATARCSSSRIRPACACPSSPALDVDRVDLADGRSARLGQGREGADRSGRRRRARGDPRVARRCAPGVRRTPSPRRCSSGASGKRITPRAIERRLAEWAVRQGLSRHVHPHMLRHSFASHVLQSSGDLRAVQEMLGHASIASTQVYTHLDFQYLAKAYDAAHPRAQAQEERADARPGVGSGLRRRRSARRPAATAGRWRPGRARLLQQRRELAAVMRAVVEECIAATARGSSRVRPSTLLV